MAIGPATGGNWKIWKKSLKKYPEGRRKKIKKCKKLVQLSYRPSSKKGFHFKLWCKIKCDICRIVYDDFRRYDYDMNRPVWARNILFDREIKFNDS